MVNDASTTENTHTDGDVYAPDKVKRLLIIMVSQFWARILLDFEIFEWFWVIYILG